MSQKSAAGARPVTQLPENVVKALRDKDRIIKIQAKRIEMLESDNEKLRKDRDSLSTKVTLLSYKLQMTSQAKAANKAASQASEGSSVVTPPSTPRGQRLPGAGLGPQGTPDSQCTTPTPGRRRTSSSNSVTSVKVQRQRSCKRTENEEKLKRSRAWANAYELSQDLHEKQLEMLERKYGGHLTARRAARVIQQAYRQYCLSKNFEKLRNEAGDKRLSRRLSEFGRSKTIWTDMVASVESIMGLHSHYTTSNGVFSDDEFSSHTEDHVNHNVTTHTSSSSHKMIRVMHKSTSLNITSAKEHTMYHNAWKPLQRNMGLDLTTIKEAPKGVAGKRKASASPEETNNNRNSYPEMNDSSASDSPQETPVEPTVDLPSVNFENLLESKETDILNDSFHSDSSQDALQQIHGISMSEFQSFSNQDHSSSIDDLAGDQTPKANGDIHSYENFRTCYPESCSDTASINSDVQIRVEDTEERHHSVQSSDSDRTPTADDPNVVTKIYANQEVRLRNKRKSAMTECAGAGPCGTVPEVSGALPPGAIPNKKSPEASPIWKRKSAQMGSNGSMSDDAKRMSNISEASEPESMDGRESREGLSSSASSDTASMGSHEGANTYNKTVPIMNTSVQSQPPSKVSDRQRKRIYRIGLNLFNKKPEKGIKYLVERRFIDNRPSAVAKFLMARKGLSKQMIGEYLGNLQKQFNMEVLQCFSEDVDLAGLQVDMALRKFQSYFRMPGEAQKIERLMEAFASRYVQCNPDQVKKFQSQDTVFLLAFAIIMLNTDLHNKSIKAERKMKHSDFIKNLRGIDDGENVDPDLLSGIYERIKATEFKPGSDHVSQVMKVEAMIIGKKPSQPLSLPHRRLVCYCRLYEVHDPNKREKLGLHQREIFLFNDVLMVTKIFSKKKNNVTYSFRASFSLCGMQVYLYETPHYKHGIRLTTNIDGKVLITFNARNEHDRSKFVDDLKEAILEMNEMEGLRIEDELHKQKMPTAHGKFNRYSKDSGVVDIELLKPTDPGINRLSAPECGGELKKTALSNSLIDLTESGLRRGSGGSLDSGMASTSSGSSGSREDNTAAGAMGGVPSTGSQKTLKSQPSGTKFSLFGKKSKSAKALSADSSDA